MDDSTIVRDQIRTFVLSLAARNGVAEVADGKCLIEQGVLDSLGIIRLVQYLEETFRVSIGDEEITVDNFRTVDQISEFVISRVDKKVQRN